MSTGYEGDLRLFRVEDGEHHTVIAKDESDAAALIVESSLCEAASPADYVSKSADVPRRYRARWAPPRRARRSVSPPRRLPRRARAARAPGTGRF